MKLHKHVLAAIAAVALLGQATAGACFIPVCTSNSSNCGYKPPVSDCGGGHGAPIIKIVIVIIIKIIGGFGCHK